ncbi:hypothetical protein T12_13544 [Trichinella patagoniensis]|uniref:Integrase zinc-binding domain-containing protein n=1 Tax=Trichinella patagoniensis TaxID=990121 RepID=A0A0V0Z8W6_9BILA|nr:hypothetical protein T12_13544 [Trichinella patagoniensis]
MHNRQTAIRSAVKPPPPAPDSSEDNRTELLSALPREEVSTNGQRDIKKTIGVYWKKDEDILTFKPPPNLKTQSRSTMRQMLSHAARVYHPLGVHSTVYWPDETRLWIIVLGWDTPLPPEIERQWRSSASSPTRLNGVGARLRRSTLPPESKHPIILPHNHPVTKLLIKDYYLRQMHAGVNQTLVAIRIRFWILRDRNATKTKKVIRSCPVCRRVDAQPYRL